MRVVMTSLAVLTLMACQKPAEAPPADMNSTMEDANAMMDMNGMAAEDPIKHTSWEYIDEEKRPIQESVDENGNYISESGTEHVDHGTVVMKDGKACFTSAMNDDGEMCWSDPKLAVGESGETVSDKGEKLAIKRVDYVAKTMPAAQ